ncbi:hypothetical protein L486_02163 [Kwoniella mangroviensis CBS 10435]|uniref:Asl1-like glycosyl hydrolase catalytic domain-containing protein n=1 Tax=Kwoniella mangroviensis CBS 10435 TaxID=1331196 RepID=A0A1B9IVE5_9TREE|nr:uncharacterized protein I203_04672 [Kwoniella mangroviensis CBS 8507]OCF59496.1 hypothetical protein L486_02163 [Kwoniella mangroviensis CBS 10435]OCF66341.1 hypothetical protein I203_04672 [Kwoniella mangroviensis CBS 8507]
MAGSQTIEDQKYPGKAGISWPIQERTSDPIAKFFEPGSKLTWHWNWSKHWKGPLVPETSPDLEIDVEFLSMVWSPDLVNDGNSLQPGWKFLLGFNEPDHYDPAVARKISPRDALPAWIEMSKWITEPDQKLVSPAVAGSVDWLKEFFSLIPPLTKPSYLAVHVYTTTFDSFVKTIENYWNTFQLPIIVTEFAMQSFDPNVPGPQSQQQVHDFMGQTTKWLDETPYIFKYSWFLACRDSFHLHGVHEYNRLMDSNAELTPLGRQYVNGGHD